jgi:hypothetical protein
MKRFNLKVKQNWIQSYLLNDDILTNGYLNDKELKNLKSFLQYCNVDRNYQLSDNVLNQTILLNLAKKFEVFNWYFSSSNIYFDIEYSNKELINEYMIDCNIKESIAKCEINNLINFFEEFYFNFIKVAKAGRNKTLTKKMIYDADNIAIIELINILKQDARIGDITTVSYLMADKLYGNLITNVLGLSEEAFKSKLRCISEENKNLRVELNQGLDNIFLTQKETKSLTFSI